jgi:hypothetical protein
MIRKSMKASDPSYTSSLLFAGDEQARDRQQILGRDSIEGDPEARIFLAPPGRTEQLGVNGPPRPGDVSGTAERVSSRERQLDLDAGARCDPPVCKAPQTTQSDVDTTRHGQQGLPGRVPEPKPGLEGDAFTASLGSSMGSDRCAHAALLEF